MKSILVLALLPLVGCASISEYLREEYEAAKKRDSPELALAKLVAATGTTQTYSTNLVTMIGHYGGRLPNGCTSVSVNTVQHKRINQFTICPDGKATRSVGVAPAIPEDTRFEDFADSITRSAWTRGVTQTGQMDGYVIEAEPVGPSDANACRHVEERVRYQDNLLRVQRIKVCP